MNDDTMPWIEPPGWWRDHDREWTVGHWTGRCTWAELLRRLWEEAGERLARDPVHQERLRIITRVAMRMEADRIEAALRILTEEER